MNSGKNDKQESIKKKNHILQERAFALAKEAKKDDVPGCDIEVLEFMLAQEYYMIETRYIDEVFPLKDLTELPCTPHFILGIANFRGRIISIIDIKIFFDLPEKGITDLNKIVLIRHEDMELGILADLIIGVKKIPTNELQSVLPTLTGIRAEYLTGITKTQKIVLNPVRLLTDPAIVVNEEVLG